MGAAEESRAHADKKKIRFGKTHLGAERMSGRAGTHEFPYIAYHECNAAAVLELCSLLSVIFGMGLMLAKYDNAQGLRPVLFWAAGILAVNRVFAVSAKLINNAVVRHKLVNDSDYARKFAVKYPEQAQICRELNMAFDANPDAVPEEEIRGKIAEEPQMPETTRKIILIVSLSFLGLVLLGLMAFCLWAMHEGI